MSAKGLSVSLLFLAALSYAQAAPVYKIVGPDGKITFSDKPPAQADSGSYQVVRGQQSSQAAPAESAAPVSAAGATPADANAAPKQASRPSSSATQIASVEVESTDIFVAEAPSPAVEGAVIGVLGIEDIVRRTEAACVEVLPTSFSTYAAAVAAWDGRNGALVARARQTLERDFDPSARQVIEVGIRSRNDALFTPVVAAAAAVRIGWCDQSFAAMGEGAMDVHGNPKLSLPLSPGR
jgi:hypothetical protein